MTKRKFTASFAFAIGLGLAANAQAYQIQSGPKPDDTCQVYWVQILAGSWWGLPYSVVDGSPSGPFQRDVLTTSYVAHTNGLPAVIVNWDVTGTVCGAPSIANVRFGLS